MKAGTTDLLLQRASELRCAMDGHLVRRASRAVLPGYLLLAMQLAEEDPLGKHVTAEWAALQSRLSYSQSPLIPRWVPAAAGDTLVKVLLLLEDYAYRLHALVSPKTSPGHTPNWCHPLPLRGTTPVRNAVYDLSHTARRCLRDEVPGQKVMTHWIKSGGIRIKDLR